MSPRPNNPHNALDATGRTLASQAWELTAEVTHLRRVILFRLVVPLGRRLRLL